MQTPPIFRQRLLAHERLVGSFVKTPTSHTTEVLGDVGFDFVVIDEEHGPFDRSSIELVILGARAAGTAAIVRVADASASRILSALDAGAAGVLVPHVRSAATAREVAAACRYRGGSRGFSAATRAGGFGRRGLQEHVDAEDAAVTLIAMIEDPEALNELDAILAVEGLDAVFIGRGDLTVALAAADQEAQEVREATARIIAAARRARKPVCLFVPSAADSAPFADAGVSVFIVGSDQSLLRQAAEKVVAYFAALPAPADHSDSQVTTHHRPEVSE